jgi:exoribonuclease II
MQKYSGEVRERIAKEAYELYEQRGRLAERDVEDWLSAKELVRKEMNDPLHEQALRLPGRALSSTEGVAPSFVKATLGLTKETLVALTQQRSFPSTCTQNQI